MTAFGLVSASAMAADVAAPADTGFKPYVSVFVGASFLNDVNTVSSHSIPYTARFNMGYILGGAAGVKWNDLLRTEIEFSHNSFGAKDYSSNGKAFIGASGPMSATYLLGNVWLDLPTHSQFTPYIGGGVGYGWANADLTFTEPKYGYQNGSGNLVWQLGAGVKFSVRDHLDIDLGYRYKALDNINFSNNTSGYTYTGGNLRSHNIELGLTYNF